jgi:dihydrofolate reductase
VIGRGNQLPWRLPSDLKRFRALTLGHPVVIGRKTFESIGRPLAGRDNIVLTQGPMRIDGVTIAPTLDDALAIARQRAGPEGEVFVLGGAEVFRQTLPLADRLYVTEVDAEPPGDACFPLVDPGVWEEAVRDAWQHPAGDSAATSFVIYERR